MQCLERRIRDGHVLKLIRSWLKVVVVEQDRQGGPPRHSRSRCGTPPGGVMSPLLANIYLHWFDKVFHRSDGPARWAAATLVRSADDCGGMARHQGERLTSFMEAKLEDWMGLKINREKTRIVNLNEEGASLDFLGFTFRYDRDLRGRKHK